MFYSIGNLGLTWDWWRMFHYQHTISTVWSLMLIFIRGKRCHMPFKLLTINKTDDTAIHHVTLVCFILRLKCVASVSSLWFYQSIHSSQPECVCDERKACRWKDYWRFLSGEESQRLRGHKGMESGKDGRSNDKRRLFWWFICGSIDGFN